MTTPSRCYPKSFMILVCTALTMPVSVGAFSTRSQGFVRASGHCHTRGNVVGGGYLCLTQQQQEQQKPSSLQLCMSQPSTSWWNASIRNRFRVPRKKVLFRLQSSSSSSSSSSLSSGEPGPNQVEISPLIKTASKQLQRLSWFSWWAQMILTTISATILVFAASVVRSGSRNTSANGMVVASPSFFLSGLAIILSAASIIWTWGNGARLSKRLLRPTTLPASQQHIQAAKLVRRAVQVQVSINLLGLLGTLLAAEEIVGSLAIKVLTTFGIGASNMYNAPLMGLQPLDILVVQANTNSLLAQFISLATSLFLTEQIRNLDPPSTLEDPRKNKK